MVICYEECDQVVRRAQDLFFARFGVRPSGHTILGAVQRHQEHGVFNPPAIDAGRPRISPELEERVLQFFRSDPEASTRDAARVFNISHTTAWHILKEEGKHPNGRYSVGGSADVGPGDHVSSAQLHVTCNPGYRPSGNHILFCVLGVWSEELPQCVRFCKLDPHPSVTYRCQATNDEFEDSYYRECNSHEPTGTIVRPQCNEPNYHFTGVLTHMRCTSGGRWNYIAICQPECGTITPDGKILIVDGREAKQGEFPWHAGIYRKSVTNDTLNKLICGESLVSSSVIISAAHCFWDKITHRLHPVTSYAVALGKFYRGWNHPLDDNVQKFDVLNIKVPARYQGAGSNFQDDIAAVWLAKPAVYAPHVRPVCIDFEPYFDAFQLRDGNLGKVAGWGIKDLEGRPSPILQVIELPYVRIEQCIEESPPNFRPFITSDKICAGYRNGSALCQGDSGGGLVFKAQDRVVERYYLRGIVSTAPESQEACNVYARTSFTKITKHKHFIEKNTEAVDQISINQQETEDEKNTEAVDQIFDKQQENEKLCVLPPYPDNGSYQTLGAPETQPGQSIRSVTLAVACNLGFRLDQDVKPSCANGLWTADMPKCIANNCLRPEHILLPGDKRSTRYRLYCADDTNGTTNVLTARTEGGLRSCEGVEPNGTLAIQQCGRNNITIISRDAVSEALEDGTNLVIDEYAHCVNGKWDADISCQRVLDCGTADLPGGSATRWVALVYQLKRGPYYEDLLHAGTIISSKYVITAGSSVSNRRGNRLLDREELLVAAGKSHTTMNDTTGTDEHAQYSNVLEIVVPANRDWETLLERNVALLVLTTPFKINPRVLPACLDARYSHDKLNSDAVTKIASWRPKNATDAMLTTVSMKFIEKQQCLDEERQDSNIQNLIKTTDKFCAKEIDGKGTCALNMGMGLMYEVNGRHYMVAVLTFYSFRAYNERNICAGKMPSLFSTIYPVEEGHL
ncbi:trypsin domain-containing protein [Phthorimaea operculella]|nr:trypsin domain-containing protein [Phthorimaea operculella]